MEKAISLDNQIGNFLRQCDGYIKGQLLSGDFNEAEVIQRWVYSFSVFREREWF